MSNVKQELLEKIANVQSFVTFMRGQRGTLRQVFGSDQLTASYLANVEVLARQYRQAEELAGVGEWDRATAVINQTLDQVHDLRMIAVRAAAAAGERTWAEHLALSDMGQSTTAAVGDVLGGIGDGARAVVNGIGETIGAAGSGLATLAKIALVVGGIVGIVWAVGQAK